MGGGDTTVVGADNGGRVSAADREVVGVCRPPDRARSVVETPDVLEPSGREVSAE